MKSNEITSNFITKTEAFIEKLPVWIIGFLLLCISFIPCLMLGGKSIFFTHDQYDGALLSYILNAKYLFEDVSTYPEWLGGVPSSGITVAAPLLIYAFICLYEKKHLPFAYFSIIFFGLTSSLIMLGYAYLAVGGILFVVFLWKKKFHKKIQ